MDYFGKSRKDYKQEGAYNYYDNFFAEVLSRLKPKNKFLYDMSKRIIDTYYSPECYKGLNPILLHHDYHMQNIVIDKNGELKVIDWDSARGGLPEADLIKIKYWNFKGNCTRDGISFINGYKSINGVPITTNYPIHELVWLLKMYLFESDWEMGRDNLYFPNANYYENIIRDRFCNYKWIDEYMKQAVKEPENAIELFFRQSIKEQDKQK